MPGSEYRRPKTCVHYSSQWRCHAHRRSSAYSRGERTRQTRKHLHRPKWCATMRICSPITTPQLKQALRITRAGSRANSWHLFPRYRTRVNQKRNKSSSLSVPRESPMLAMMLDCLHHRRTHTPPTSVNPTW